MEFLTEISEIYMGVLYLTLMIIIILCTIVIPAIAISLILHLKKYKYSDGETEIIIWASSPERAYRRVKRTGNPNKIYKLTNPEEVLKDNKREVT